MAVHTLSDLITTVSNIIEPHHNCSKVTVQSNFSKATVQRQLFKIIPTVARKKCDCSELLKITVGVKKIKTIQSPYEKKYVVHNLV